MSKPDAKTQSLALPILLRIQANLQPSDSDLTKCLRQAADLIEQQEHKAAAIDEMVAWLEGTQKYLKGRCNHYKDNGESPDTKRLRIYQSKYVAITAALDVARELATDNAKDHDDELSRA